MGEHFRRFKQQVNQIACRLFGGHELYRILEPGHIYQRCLCGYTTAGWQLKREVKHVASTVQPRQEPDGRSTFQGIFDSF